MTPYEIISAKRDQKKLATAQIDFVVKAYMAGEMTDYQMSALLMAIYLNGMDFEETTALTKSYIASGTVVDLADIPGIKVDKHSTGGVGDKVSIVLAPLVAALDVPVPMISGRGLGHSGGTLDKLESIPGFRTDLSIERFRELLVEHRLGLIGQTADIVPADKRIYALRDVTATVDCIPLISASIMSKKIAEGIDALVLDVKYGSGAFMKSAEDAEALAKTLIRIGHGVGKTVVALLTDMNQPLGHKIGNWLEIEESLDCLLGKGPADLMAVTYALCAEMLVLADRAPDTATAQGLLEEGIRSGAAYQKFFDITRAQGGDCSFLENRQQMSEAVERETIIAERDGFLAEMDTYKIGMASVLLGAGRIRAEDGIDPLAGMIFFRKVGDPLKRGEPIVELRASSAEKLARGKAMLEHVIAVADAPPQSRPMVLKRLTIDDC